MVKSLKALTVDFELLEQSMRDVCREADDYYFNRVTGRIISLSRKLIGALMEDERIKLESLPEWEARMIPLARDIVLSGSIDFVRIPEAFGRPEQNWRIEFAKQIRSTKLKQNLLLALRGRGSCRRFKEILKEHPEEQRQWALIRTRSWQDKIQTWLESLGILAIADNPKKSRTATR